MIMATLQFFLNSILYEGPNHEQDLDSNYLRTRDKPRVDEPESPYHQADRRMNSYDVLLKNAIHYGKNASLVESENKSLKNLQEQIDNLRSQITTLESKSQKYTDDPLFFPFVIRDSRHLTPVQINPDFHVFDYVDLTQAKQPKAKHSQLLHNARLVIDDVLEAKRARQPTAKKKKHESPAEKFEAPCQKYSIECYAQKILQVFSYVLREFPSVEYYFYVEADNDLCVPMTMVKDLALKEKRYFINTGIGFSGWIMSREFLADFIELYSNATSQVEQEASKSKIEVSSDSTTDANATTTTTTQEIRPDVLASYYLTDRSAWTVTRQYWVSHTTLESLGVASLTVKDRRKDATGERLGLDKHLPRCLEPRRGKWKVSRRKPYLDPRDRFGWDYFDYDVCPDEILFPCKGQDQLKKLVEDDWRVANQTGALEHQKKIEERRRKKAEKAKLAQKQKEMADQAVVGAKNGNNEGEKEKQDRRDDSPNDKQKQNA